MLQRIGKQHIMIIHYLAAPL